MTTRAAAAVEPVLVGRDPEVDRIRQLVRSTNSGARFVVIHGEAGIGKTALWRWGVEQYRRAGHRVLVTRPSEEELHGPMTGLLDLFEEVDTAPGTLDAEADVFDRGRAVLRTLRELSSAAPVVVAIDDLQWLDAISARALRYAARRLDREPVVVLATERVDADAPAEIVLPSDRVEEVGLGPLSPEAIHQVVRAVVGTISRSARCPRRRFGARSRRDSATFPVPFSPCFAPPPLSAPPRPRSSPAPVRRPARRR